MLIWRSGAAISIPLWERLTLSTCSNFVCVTVQCILCLFVCSKSIRLTNLFRIQANIYARDSTARRPGQPLPERKSSLERTSYKLVRYVMSTCTWMTARKSSSCHRYYCWQFTLFFDIKKIAAFNLIRWCHFNTMCMRVMLFLNLILVLFTLRKQFSFLCCCKLDWRRANQRYSDW